LGVPTSPQSTTSTQMYSSQGNPTCSKKDPHHCSPICISRSSVVGNHQTRLNKMKKSTSSKEDKSLNRYHNLKYLLYSNN
jgi:hypothetical protein